VDLIAKKLGFSRQTLFRRLKVEGATFEKVLDELRHKLALHYSSGEKVSVNETAYLFDPELEFGSSRRRTTPERAPARPGSTWWSASFAT
jgi:hypothetical protein